MQMTYWWGSDVVILLEGWNTNGSWLYYSLSMIALFMLSIAYELLATLRINDEERMRAKQAVRPGINDPTPKRAATPNELDHLRHSLLYVLQLVFAYQLMLAIMTFNVGISIAVFSGAFLGHFLFHRYRKNASLQGAGCH